MATGATWRPVSRAAKVLRVRHGLFEGEEAFNHGGTQFSQRRGHAGGKLLSWCGLGTSCW